MLIANADAGSHESATVDSAVEVLRRHRHVEVVATSDEAELADVLSRYPGSDVVVAGGDGSRKPTENELAGARYQGRVIAGTAKKLHG